MAESIPCSNPKCKEGFVSSWPHPDRCDWCNGRGWEWKVNYEYCVMSRRFPDEPHRIPKSREECEEWIREAVEEDGIKPGAFYVARRVIGDWEKM